MTVVASSCAIKVDHGDFIDIAYGFRVEYGGRIFVTAMTQDTMKT